MTVNSFFNNNQFYKSEVDIVDTLKKEAIQIKGHDVSYMLREMIDRDYLYGESKISSFNEYFVIEMYIRSIQSANGQSDIFEKFGLTLTDQAEFEVHTGRFVEEGIDFGIDRPREGDLIYLRPSDQLYEIKKVKKSEEFYQLGKNYTYTLSCNLFVYSHEEIANDVFGGIQDFNLKSLLDTDGDITVTETNLQETKEELYEEVDLHTIINHRNLNQ